MYLISHRGNLNGPKPDAENTMAAVRTALDKGFDCEVDVWLIDDIWYLGHDRPEQATTLEFICREGIWCHAKNLDALRFLNKIGAEVFWHERDARTLTSWGHIWTYPGQELCEDSICVHLGTPINLGCPEAITIAGICSDYIEQFAEIEYEAGHTNTDE